MGIWAKIEKQMRCKFDFSNAALVNFHDTGSRQLLINWTMSSREAITSRKRNICQVFYRCFITFAKEQDLPLTSSLTDEIIYNFKNLHLTFREMISQRFQVYIFIINSSR